MKTISRSMIITSLALSIAVVANAQPQQTTSKEPTQIGEYKISGPYTYENLTIFLFHGRDKLKGHTYLTLQEAMEQQKVVVHETGNVNELAIENVSDTDVYVQSGDIVKGGQQDRVFAFDVIVPPKSGKLPIAAFCVESGRWSRRGQERADVFNQSTQQLASRELKVAAKSGLSRPSLDHARQVDAQAQQQMAQQSQQNQQQAQQQSPQQQVWSGVAYAQRQLQQKTEEYVQGKGGDYAMRLTQAQEQRASPDAQAALQRSGQTAEQRDLWAADTQRQVVSPQSPSSLQLALESRPVQQITEDYVKNLAGITDGRKDAVGFAFAINGKLNSADVYGSHALFLKLWPKLLRAAAVESLAEFQKDGTFAPATVDALTSCVADAEKGKSADKDVSPRVKMTTKETEKNLLFDTFDRGNGGACIHRNFLTKPSPSK